jgi:hypothetical protein
MLSGNRDLTPACGQKPGVEAIVALQQAARRGEIGERMPSRLWHCQTLDSMGITAWARPYSYFTEIHVQKWRSFTSFRMTLAEALAR